MIKKCKTCHKEKPLSDFYKHNGCLQGVRPDCKKCWLKRSKEYQKYNHDKYIAYQRSHYADNKDKYDEYAAIYRGKKQAWQRNKYATDEKYREKVKAGSRKWHNENQERKKDKNLQRQYGITLFQLNELLDMQNDSCAICGFKNDGNTAMFPFVDHCHSTGLVRGLLCSKCNFGIGLFNDDIGLLGNAINYLEDKV